MSFIEGDDLTSNWVAPRVENPVPEFLFRVFLCLQDYAGFKHIVRFGTTYRKGKRVPRTEKEQGKIEESLVRGREEVTMISMKGYLEDAVDMARLRRTVDADECINLHGMVHNIRDMGRFSFVELRLREGVIQCICDHDTKISDGQPLQDEMSIRCTGTVSKDSRAPNGFEVHINEITVLARPEKPRPVALGKKRNKLSLETELSLRPVVIRHSDQRYLFKLQEGLCRGFRGFLHGEQFTEIHSPKIVSTGAEGGSNIFKLEYFHRKAYLAQSPQLYKQMMVGVFERVYETGPVFRAEKHSTVRHLNEYTSLDFEMGFIDSFYDVMNMETAMIQHVFDLLVSEYADALEHLDIKLACPAEIPVLRFSEAKERIAERYGFEVKDPNDLEPEEERLIGRLVKEDMNSDFVFITHYPSKKRPFYTMDDPKDPKYSLSFDLLYKGLEITTGGQRIHAYQQQIDKMLRLGMNPEIFASYLQAHACGLPPHGGLGIGLERFLMQMAGKDNIRETSLFPRDLSRLEP